MLKETFGPASQAEMYLARALEEFHHASNAPDLWVPADALHRGSMLASSQEVLTAKNRRLHFLRSAVLFAALSAEAFANAVERRAAAPRSGGVGHASGAREAVDRDPAGGGRTVAA
jgi:hypothetical protein